MLNVLQLKLTGIISLFYQQRYDTTCLEGFVITFTVKGFSSHKLL